VPRAPVCWLTCEGDNRTTSARVHLIVNQMAQALIVGWTEEDFCVDNDTCVRVVQRFIAIALETEAVQLVSNIWILDITKRRRIAIQTVVASKL
jgi:hypothetical protein